MARPPRLLWPNGCIYISDFCLSLSLAEFAELPCQIRSTPVMSLNPAFSDAQLQIICETANVIACECPAQLVDLLRKIREFRHYTINCIELAPEEAEIHHWLSDEIIQVEALLSNIIVEFMRREDLFDEQQQLDLGKLRDRNTRAALRQRQLMQQPWNHLNADQSDGRV
ncbi:MAG: hypothetical protein HC895_22735 [Leptolyngbyaceae cyanobacterium SM1_3_5]|nr:hypothetical protein [Leptolyngbyaceae cyanobacterium SM1_3_5]